MNCPYAILDDHNDSMNVIKHQNNCIHLNVRIPYGKVFPDGLDDASCSRKSYLVINNLPKDSVDLECADSDKIRSWL
jgi:hypothetical protein